MAARTSARGFRAMGPVDEEVDDVPAGGLARGERREQEPRQEVGRAAFGLRALLRAGLHEHRAVRHESEVAGEAEACWKPRITCLTTSVVYELNWAGLPSVIRAVARSETAAPPGATGACLS